MSIMALPSLAAYAWPSDRLRTIINYDRVVVMDEGRIVELGAPADLYAQEQGIFRGMCEQSGIDGDEIGRSRGVL